MTHDNERNFFVKRNPTISFIQNNFDVNYKINFTQAQGKWERNIRDFLKENLGIKKLKESTPISLAPDKNNFFTDVVNKHFSDLDFFEYLYFQDLLTASTQVNPWLDAVEKEKIEHIKLIAREHLKKYNFEEINKIIFEQLISKNNDLFGAYFINEHRIELYYVPIVLFSILNRISIEGLVSIILTHELAHAYQHIGMDIDGKIWNSFAQVNDYVLEPLAQYYTEKYVESKKEYHSEILNAFEVLSRNLTGPYKKHKEWITAKYNFEHVRAAFIEARISGIKSTEDFEKMLLAAKTRHKNKNELDFG